MTVIRDLTAANSTLGNTYIKAAGQLAKFAFENLGSWRDADLLRYLARINPALSGVKLKAAQSTVAFYKALADLNGEDFTHPALTAADVTTSALRNGVPNNVVYNRPFVDLRTALSQGKSMTEAIAAGGRRAQSLASTEVQLARRGAGLKARNANDRIVGYIRTLTGNENCALCTIASTQRYRRGDLLPIHPGCDCGEAQIYGTQDPGQVINQVRLDNTYESIEQQLKLDPDFGARDAGLGKVINSPTEGEKLADYTELIITSEHGELGPVIRWRDQNFTNFDNLELTNTKTYTSISEVVADSENLQAQIDSIYDTKLDSRANGNVPMRALLEQSGKNGKPDLVDSVEDLSGDTIYYRGSSNENIDEFMSEERHRIGLGIHGDGYYFSTKKSTGDAFATYGQGQGFADGKVMTGALKPDAKIFKINGSLESGVDDLKGYQTRALSQFDYRGEFRKAGEEFFIDNYLLTYQDAFTTELILQGYDGIEVNEPNGASDEKYLVLFNRQAMEIVKKTEVPFAE